MATNTEFAQTVSGAGTYLQSPVYTQIFSVSGGNASFSGQMVLHGWVINPISGGQASYSGVQIRLQEGVSGTYTRGSGAIIISPTSGIKVFLEYDFGAHSGLGTANLGILTAHPLDVIGLNFAIRSGLVVATSGVGFNVQIFASTPLA